MKLVEDYKAPHEVTFQTVVGEYLVDVCDAEYPTLMRMRHGKKDNVGVYAFWTAVCRKDGGGITGRARVGLSAGDRFDRMFIAERQTDSVAARRTYAAMLHEQMGSGAKIKFIRPSNIAEVRSWVNSHLYDTQSADILMIGKSGVRKFKKGRL